MTEDLQAQVTRRMAKNRPMSEICALCGEKIIGKQWRIDNDRVACTRCNNEKPGT